MAPAKYEYIVMYGGGLGPDVWDAELVVTGYNIKEALDKAVEELSVDIHEPLEAIISIEQAD